MHRGKMSTGSSLMPKPPPRKDQPIIPMDLVFGAIVWYVVAALIAWAIVPPNGGWTDTAKVIGATMGIATAIFAPISAIVLARYQAQLTGSLGAELEELKSVLLAGLEVKKALIAGRIRAFDTMLTSAHFFYYVLRQVTFVGDVESENMLREAGQRAAEASSVVWYLSPEDKDKWYRVSQNLITLGGSLKRESFDKRREVFNSNTAELGEAIEELEQAGLTNLKLLDSDS